ncbi:membrane protein [Vibrio sp. qd031]|uniref:porin n=1 Tax=Vibrio sp. qd031 TaxID=1603038 RepID=UPI000A0FFC9A|nr:porin [Vibrio sp. qd031]ORT48911.1 membrane protein [Vibrio sp. qd031]
MNKTLIALAIAGATMATTAHAAELYNNGDSTFSVGGHLSLSAAGSDEGDVGVTSNSPRINMEATHNLGAGYTMDVKGEWATNLLNGGEQAFTTRLGYMGITHDVYGRAVAGTQWAPYYDVAGAADMPIAFATDYLYDDHGNLGTGRANSMLSYRNSVDFGDAGVFNLGLGIQGRTDTGSTEYVYDSEADSHNEVTKGAHYGNRAQVALSYDFAGFNLGYAYNSGDFTFEDNSKTETASSNLVSAKYGSYGAGLYVAAVYANNNFMNAYDSAGAKDRSNTIEESTATEFIVAYALDNSLNVSLNYENVEDAIDSKNVLSHTAIQAEYNFTPKFVGFAGYQVDLGDDYGSEKDNKWNFGARYYL